jgi:DNA-binding beta-propeller fold protein YncE
VTLDSASERVFVIDRSQSNPRIIGYDLATGSSVFTWNGATTPPLRPDRIAWDASGSRIVFRSGDAVVAVDPATGSSNVISSALMGIGQGPALSGTPFFDLDLAVSADGLTVYAAGTAPPAVTGQILAIDVATGNRALIASIPPVEPGGFGVVSSILEDPTTGHLILGDITTKTILDLDPATGTTTVISGGGVGQGPSPVLMGSVGIDPDTGRILLGDLGSGSILLVDRATGDRSVLVSRYGEAILDLAGDGGLMPLAGLFTGALPRARIGVGLLQIDTGQVAVLDLTQVP